MPLLSIWRDPKFLRTDNFAGFFETRRRALLAIVEGAMGKQAVITSELPPESGAEVDDDEE